MIDITEKSASEREALVVCTVHLSEEAVSALHAGELPKGDALEVARIAGTLAAKRTPDLIPFCHPIPITAVEVGFQVDLEERTVHVEARAKARAATGVEMEAFCAAAVAAVTIYDMCKGIDPGAEIGGLRLVRKSGGKGGLWERSGPR